MNFVIFGTFTPTPRLITIYSGYNYNTQKSSPHNVVVWKPFPLNSAMEHESLTVENFSRQHFTPLGVYTHPKSPSHIVVVWKQFPLNLRGHAEYESYLYIFSMANKYEEAGHAEYE
jgi:hypothetical protein